MVEPQKTRDLIENEAQAIWNITELLGKVGEADDGEVTLSTVALQYFSRQIAEKLNNIVEQVEGS